MDKNEVLDKAYEMLQKTSDMLLEAWADKIVFSWRWWLQVVLTVLPWILWIKFRDKKRSGRLLFVGLFMALITNLLDIIGMSFGGWHYDWNILPLVGVYVPWDWSLFPVFVMFFLQLKPKVKPIIKAIIIGFMSAFIFEPFFEWLRTYHIEKWSIFYSFFIYIFIYLICDYVYKSRLLNDLS